MILSEKIKPFSIQYDISISEALKQMDNTFYRLLIVFKNDKYIGLLSIGDIQRAIINNKGLNIPINEILRKDITVCFENDSFELIKNKMLKFRTEFMPIINYTNNLIDIVFWEDLFPKEERKESVAINLPVVIMAGGEGSRLKPITNILPKPLIPIGEKTIIENIMDQFVEVGCNNFYISVNYKADIIKYYFNALNNKNYNITYVQEPKPLGTAGSLFMLKNKINSTFIVSNCDILIKEDFSEIYNYHKKNKNEVTIVAAMKQYKIPYGTLKTGLGGKLISIDEKPEITYKINSGLYILEPHLLKSIPENEFFHITHLIESLIKENGKVGVFPVSEKSWIDIGEWNEYLKNINKQ